MNIWKRAIPVTVESIFTTFNSLVGKIDPNDFNDAKFLCLLVEKEVVLATSEYDLHEVNLGILHDKYVKEVKISELGGFVVTKYKRINPGLSGLIWVSFSPEMDGNESIVVIQI